MNKDEQWKLREVRIKIISLNFFMEKRKPGARKRKSVGSIDWKGNVFEGICIYKNKIYKEHEQG